MRALPAQGVRHARMRRALHGAHRAPRPGRGARRVMGVASMTSPVQAPRVRVVERARRSRFGPGRRRGRSSWPARPRFIMNAGGWNAKVMWGSGPSRVSKPRNSAVELMKMHFWPLLDEESGKFLADPNGGASPLWSWGGGSEPRRIGGPGRPEEFSQTPFFPQLRAGGMWGSEAGAPEGQQQDPSNEWVNG